MTDTKPMDAKKQSPAGQVDNPELPKMGILDGLQDALRSGMCNAHWCSLQTPPLERMGLEAAGSPITDSLPYLFAILRTLKLIQARQGK